MYQFDIYQPSSLAYPPPYFPRFSKWWIRCVFKRCDRTEINTEEKQEKMTQKALNQQLKDLKELLEETNGKIAALDERITHNHNELMGKIIVEQTANQALQTAKKKKKKMKRDYLS